MIPQRLKITPFWQNFAQTTENPSGSGWGPLQTGGVRLHQVSLPEQDIHLTNDMSADLRHGWSIPEHSDN